MLAIADWITIKLQAALAHEGAFAAIVALTLGVFVSESIIRIIPADYSTFRAQRLLRLIAGGTALCAGFALQPSARGFLIAMVCGLAGPTVHDLAFGWLYARWPSLKPPVLKTESEKCSGS